MMRRGSLCTIAVALGAVVLLWAAPIRADSGGSAIEEQTAKTEASSDLVVKEYLEQIEFHEQRAAELREEAASHRQKAEKLKNRPIAPNYKSGLYRQPDRHIQKARALELQAAESERTAQKLLNKATKIYLADEVSAVD